jgi:hypothetical protein
MRKIELAMTLFLTVILVLNAWSQPSLKDLKVRLKLDKAIYLSGEPVWAEVRVFNPDSVMLTAWLSPRLVTVAGIQVFSSDGKEVPTHCWDARINTPVTLAMPPLKTGFLSRVELSQCFSSDPDRVFLPGNYGVRSRFTNLDGDQAVRESVSFTVREPEGAEKALYQEILKTKDRAKMGNLLRKNSGSVYAPLMAMKYFGGVAPKGGKKILQQGVDLCKDLIAQGPDRISSTVLVDSIASLSGRLAGDSMARQNLNEIINRFPRTMASEEAGVVRMRLGMKDQGGGR